VRGLVVSLLVIAVACGGDGAVQPADAETLTTCREVGEQSVLVLEETVAIIDELTPTEASLLAGGGTYPPQFAEVEMRGRALTERALDLGCDRGVLDEVLAEAAADIRSTTQLGQFVVTGIASGSTRIDWLQPDQ
jgi:hypothetical protein